jgi:hypothetical protein
VRYYNGNLDCAKLEIKRRSQDRIRKDVARVNAYGVSQVVACKRLKPTHLGWEEPSPGFANASDQYAMRQFCELQDGLAASGQVIVDYWRQAYVANQGDSPRITFDRELRGGICRTVEDLASPRADFQPRVGGVILEIKFSPPRPVWLLDLIQQFDLRRRSVPKYVLCAGVLKQDRAGSHVGRWPAVQTSASCRRSAP